MKTILKNTEIHVPSYDLGSWTFSPEFGSLSNISGEEFFIDKRLNKILTILLIKDGQIAKREEMIDFVWSDVQVNEESLTKGIFDLRKTLKEKGLHTIDIATIRNIGYRLTIDGDKVNVGKVRSQIIFKSLLYIFLISTFLIMFIRAIRYDQ